MERSKEPVKMLEWEFSKFGIYQLILTEIRKTCHGPTLKIKIGGKTCYFLSIQKETEGAGRFFDVKLWMKKPRNDFLIIRLLRKDVTVVGFGRGEHVDGSEDVVEWFNFRGADIGDEKSTELNYGGTYDELMCQNDNIVLGRNQLNNACEQLLSGGTEDFKLPLVTMIVMLAEGSKFTLIAEQIATRQLVIHAGLINDWGDISEKIWEIFYDQDSTEAHEELEGYMARLENFTGNAVEKAAKCLGIIKNFCRED